MVGTWVELRPTPTLWRSALLPPPAPMHHVPPEFYLRHKHGDWGDLCAEDCRENERAVRVGSWLFSAYLTRTEEKLWVITEWDRSVTTLLLPEEY